MFPGVWKRRNYIYDGLGWQARSLYKLHQLFSITSHFLDCKTLYKSSQKDSVILLASRGNSARVSATVSVELIPNVQRIPKAPPGKWPLVIVHWSRHERCLDQVGQVYPVDANVRPDIVIQPHLLILHIMSLLCWSCSSLARYRRVGCVQCCTRVAIRRPQSLCNPWLLLGHRDELGKSSSSLYAYPRNLATFLGWYSNFSQKVNGKMSSERHLDVKESTPIT